MENRQDTISFMSFFAEERERSECSMVLPKLAPELRPSRRPRSPSSNHNVKEPRLRANFHSSRSGSRLQDRSVTGSEARYIGALDFRCQTLKGLNLQNFPEAFLDASASAFEKVQPPPFGDGLT